MENMTVTEDSDVSLNSTRVTLYAGGVAAILASICCIGLFLFSAIGLSHSTSLYLITLAEWSRIPLLLIALGTLFFVYKRIWHPVSIYKPSKDCANSKATMTNKVFFLVVAALVIGMFMLPYAVPNMDY